ncbi:cell division control protein [Vairimorpha apis BRL 01]|uniref:Cell division control protein n=1 Tax=Vairimorpha apis BRL 01 TaxID=1037528 RepID=T0KY33_9MICR|nr:cell division control protein [Vairimorpha apis BRL 01]
MNQKGIGVSNLPNLKYRSVCKQGLDFNIMTIGTHGIGKSSFINSLFDSHLLIDDDSSNFQIYTFSLVENEFKTNITLTEVDNYGDSSDNSNCWERITKYIKDCFKDYFEKEKQNVRNLIVDKRIHVCFYFLEPNINFIRQSDLITMKEISKHCNLIPIVGKCDLLNENQIAECYKFLRNTFEENGIFVFEESSQKDSIEEFYPPYFLVCPDKEGRQIREYSYGSVQVKDIITNDLYRIRDQIINKNVIDLIENTEEYYDKFRAVILYNQINTKVNSNINKELFNTDISKDLKDEEETIKELQQRISEKKAMLNN